MQKEMIEYISTKQGLFYLQNIGFFLFLVLLSGGLTYLCRRYVRVMDYASGRSLHEGSIPRSGGIPIVITFCIGILIYYIFRDSYFIEQSAFWGLFISAIMISAVSFYDDITNRSFIYKLISQLIGVVILIIFGLTLNEWSVPYIGKIVFGPYRYILTVLWIVGITNAFNFMDGLNGLAAGVAAIVFISFSVITYHLGSGVSFHIGYIIAASCLGFLFYNFPKASIFMGDVGSTFLGFCLGAMAILSSHYEHHHTTFMVIPILLANFIMETFYTFIWRLCKGQPIYKAHKLHPYQLLNQMGVSAKRVTLLYYGQSLLLVCLCMAYVRSLIPMRTLILTAIIISYSIYFVKVHKVAKARGLI